MCTVTFIPQGEYIIITSNRDERTSRPTAFAPSEEIRNGKKIFFPKDPQAGGTWFVAVEDGSVAVLLNGGFVAHIPQGNYRLSRGIVLLDIVTSEDPHAALSSYSLIDIEPFTILLFVSAQLYELIWDGVERYIKELASDQPHIYSSATLYSSTVIAERQKWFADFMAILGVKDPADVRKFHATAGHGDDKNGLIINRDNSTKTFSITQAVISADAIDFYHHDLLTGAEDHKHLSIL